MSNHELRTEDLRISWLLSLSGGTCDFCSRDVKRGMRVAYLHDLIVTIDEPATQMIMPGDWGLCPVCQEALNIQREDLTVSLARVAEYHRQVAMPAVLVGLGSSADVGRLQQSLHYAVESST